MDLRNKTTSEFRAVFQSPLRVHYSWVALHINLQHASNYKRRLTLFRLAPLFLAAVALTHTHNLNAYFYTLLGDFR